MSGANLNNLVRLKIIEKVKDCSSRVDCFPSMNEGLCFSTYWGEMNLCALQIPEPKEILINNVWSLAVERG